MRDKINSILDDRVSGSLALLNRLIDALEEMLPGNDLNAEEFGKLLITLRERLNHFAAIGNFLASLIIHAGQEDDFPGEPLRFISDYRLYWQDSEKKIAGNFLSHCKPEGLTFLTHSQSETVFSLLEQLHSRQLPFRVIQTRSSPGEEGKISHQRMLGLKIQAELIEDENMEEAIARSDIILMGCDALLKTKFLNKTGTHKILEQAKRHQKSSFLVTESRKEIAQTDWKSGLSATAPFEWVPLNLIERIITET